MSTGVKTSSCVSHRRKEKRGESSCFENTKLVYHAIKIHFNHSMFTVCQKQACGMNDAVSRPDSCFRPNFLNARAVTFSTADEWWFYLVVFACHICRSDCFTHLPSTGDEGLPKTLGSHGNWSVSQDRILSKESEPQSKTLLSTWTPGTVRAITPMQSC